MHVQILTDFTELSTLVTVLHTNLVQYGIGNVLELKLFEENSLKFLYIYCVPKHLELYCLFVKTIASISLKVGKDFISVIICGYCANALLLFPVTVK